MTAYLLDVNVLLALFDPRQVSHDAAHQRFRSIGRRSWATYPVTENGGIASHPSYPGCPGSPQEILAILRQFRGGKGHRFLADEVSLMDDRLFTIGAAVNHGHLTDIYLLGLSLHRGGKLATLDRHIPVAAVHGEPRRLISFDRDYCHHGRRGQRTPKKSAFAHWRVICLECGSRVPAVAPAAAGS